MDTEPIPTDLAHPRRGDVGTIILSATALILALLATGMLVVAIILLGAS